MMTANDYSTRTSVLLDTVHEHDHEHEHDHHPHHHDVNNHRRARSPNETNLTLSPGADHTDPDRSQSPNKLNSDLNAKRSRIQAVFSSRSNANDKKTTPTNIVHSVGVLSQPTSNPNAKANGQNVKSSTDEPAKVVATLFQHASAAMPVASLSVSPSRTPAATATATSSTSSSTSISTPTSTTTTTTTTTPTITTTTNSSNATAQTSAAKQFLIRRVRSRSKSDPQSVPEKSLFSRFFPKKMKKPLPALITTSSKSIEPGQHLSPNVNGSMTPNGTRRSTEAVYDAEDDEFDERIISTSSLSDTDPNQHSKENQPNTSQSLNPTRSGTRTNSGNGRTSIAGPNALTLPTSDSEYYASMTAAPKGFSISYHRCTNRPTDDLRMQAAFTRFQKNKQTNSNGANFLQSLFQDQKRPGSQSPNHLPSGTRVAKTSSGQTIFTRTNSIDHSTSYSIRPTCSSPTYESDEIFVSDEELYSHFMKTHTCYDVMPKSSKLVIFDTQLAVKKAFYALVYNGVRAAPLWDTKRQKFVGMLTITDFILILQKYYKEPNAKIEELEEHRIETWRDVLKEYEKPLLCISPSASLHEAVRILTENHVHRLPIVDPMSNNVVFILTHKRVLRFFHLYFNDWPKPPFMSKTVEELNVGTYNDLHIINDETTIIDALNIFVKYRISALPVVDNQNRLVNIYSKFDVIGLAADKTYTNLNMTISEALSYRKDRSEGVAKCYRNESLSVCLERIVKAEVHRLVVVDQDEHVIGVLSLSDLLHFIVIRPGKTSLNNVLSVPTINILNEDEQTETSRENLEE